MASRACKAIPQFQFQPYCRGPISPTRPRTHHPFGIQHFKSVASRRAVNANRHFPKHVGSVSAPPPPKPPPPLGFSLIAASTFDNPASAPQVQVVGSTKVSVRTNQVKELSSNRGGKIANIPLPVVRFLFIRLLNYFFFAELVVQHSMR